VVRGEEVLQESLLGLDEKGSPQHATALLTEVERSVEAAGGWDEVGSIAVGVGPGSFTGLRIGIATARAAGLSRGLPVVGVCTLDAIGLALAGRGAEASQSLAVLDARREEMFWALYGHRAERLWDPSVGAPDALAARLEGLERPPLCAGSGAVRFRHQLESLGIEVPDDKDGVHRVSARHICALAETREDESAVEPIYLRPPDAERWRERDTVQTTD
jgi:tRNA threonylcarbamoyladenosine biosynthesis protein TsaB